MAWNEKIKKELKYCGENVFIGYNTIFTNPSEVVLDDNVRIDPFSLITTKLHVGSYSQICSHTVLGGGSLQKIELKGWNFIGYGSKLFTASEDYSGNDGPVNEFWGKNKIFRGDIAFDKYSGVASDVVVFPGVTLSQGCAIGAQSLVRNKPLQKWSLYWGSPLKFIKLRNKENIISKATDASWLKNHKTL